MWRDYFHAWLNQIFNILPGEKQGPQLGPRLYIKNCYLAFVLHINEIWFKKKNKNTDRRTFSTTAGLLLSNVLNVTHVIHPQVKAPSLFLSDLEIPWKFHLKTS